MHNLIAWHGCPNEPCQATSSSRYLHDSLEIINRKGLPGKAKTDLCPQVQDPVSATVGASSGPVTSRTFLLRSRIGTSLTGTRIIKSIAPVRRAVMVVWGSFMIRNSATSRSGNPFLK